LSEALKTATAEAHRHAESRELQRQLLRGRLAPRLLVRYLGQLHRVHAELERLLDAAPRAAVWTDWSDARRHSRRLAQDLAVLGASEDTTAPTPTARRLLTDIGIAAERDPAALVGSFYVLEGSMNGNRFIVRALRQGSTGDRRCTFAYFDPYGDAQPTTWTAFKAALDAAPLDLQQQRAAVEAAQRLFQAIADISDEVMADAHDARVDSTAR
jgi:heme oxygenase